MEILSTPTPEQIQTAAKNLKNGLLVAFPTETVYGLGADAVNEIAVSRIYSVKGRPSNHPLIVHIASIDQLDQWTRNIPEYARKLANVYWPGPMTLLLKRSNLAQDFITGGQDIVGIRIPSHPTALALLQEFEKIGGLGIAEPSANRFSAVSATSALAVWKELSKYCNHEDLIIDGGDCSIGIESTIIDCTTSKPVIKRIGALLKSDISSTLGLNIDQNLNASGYRSSGTHIKHYSPKANLKLNTTPKPLEGLIALNKIPTPPGAIRLCSPRNN